MNNKKRSTNFTKDEEILLLSEVEKEKDAIECKVTNKVNWTEKEVAWEKVTKRFNSKNSQCRSKEQLKVKYDNLKCKARKVVAAQNLQLKGTGGGPALYGTTDPVVELVLQVINMKTVVGLHNPFDSDAQEPEETFNIKGGRRENSEEETGYEHENVPIIIEVPPDVPITAPVAIMPPEKQIKDTEPATCSTSSEISPGKEPGPLTSSRFSSKRIRDNWSTYTPKKLKQPVSKQLRPVIPNPLFTAKAEYYKMKKLAVEEEVKNQQAEENRKKREEERREEEHRKKMIVLDLQAKKLIKELNEYK